MSAIAVSNSVPFGGRLETVFDKNAVNLGSYRFEQITITRPGKKIVRPDHEGKERDEWVMVDGQVTMTAQIQIPLSSSQWPLLGAYFTDNFGGGYYDASNNLTLGPEKFVITSVGQTFAAQNFYVSNIELTRSTNP